MPDAPASPGRRSPANPATRGMALRRALGEVLADPRVLVIAASVFLLPAAWVGGTVALALWTRCRMGSLLVVSSTLIGGGLAFVVSGSLASVVLYAYSIRRLLDREPSLASAFGVLKGRWGEIVRSFLPRPGTAPAGEGRPRPPNPFELPVLAAEGLERREAGRLAEAFVRNHPMAAASVSAVADLVVTVLLSLGMAGLAFAIVYASVPGLWVVRPEDWPWLQGSTYTHIWLGLIPGAAVFVLVAVVLSCAGVCYASAVYLYARGPEDVRTRVLGRFPEELLVLAGPAIDRFVVIEGWRGAPAELPADGGAPEVDASTLPPPDVETRSRRPWLARLGRAWPTALTFGLVFFMLCFMADLDYVLARPVLLALGRRQEGLVVGKRVYDARRGPTQYRLTINYERGPSDWPRRDVQTTPEGYAAVKEDDKVAIRVLPWLPSLVILEDDHGWARRRLLYAGGLLVVVWIMWYAQELRRRRPAGSGRPGA